MDPVVQTLLQSGVAGLVAVIAGFVIKSLFTRMEEDHDQEVARLIADKDAAQARADRYEAELSKTNGAMQDVLVNTIVKATVATEAATEAVADARAAVRRS